MSSLVCLKKYLKLKIFKKVFFFNIKWDNKKLCSLILKYIFKICIHIYIEKNTNNYIQILLFSSSNQFLFYLRYLYSYTYHIFCFILIFFFLSLLNLSHKRKGSSFVGEKNFTISNISRSYHLHFQFYNKNILY